MNKTFATFIMYTNSFFPITDLPRGLGLNFFSLVNVHDAQSSLIRGSISTNSAEKKEKKPSHVRTF